MTRALIIDDENRAANLLKIVLEKEFPKRFEIETAFGAEEGLIKIKDFKPDLLFLDIEMPIMNGFELLVSLPEKKFKIIFITAYDKYAIRAFRYNALDYLLKPINPKELTEAVNRFMIQKEHSTENYEKQLDNLIQNKDKNLAITTYDGVIFLPIDSIMRCEAELNYTKFFLTENKSFLSSKTLKEYEDILLPYKNFIRVHRSHLINTCFIIKYKNEGNILMKDSSIIPVSRRKKEEVIKKLKMAKF